MRYNSNHRNKDSGSINQGLDKRGWVEDSQSRVDEETKIAEGDHLGGFEVGNSTLLLANNSLTKNPRILK